MVCNLIPLTFGNPCSKISGANRKKLAQSEPKLVASLVMLMDSPSLKVQCQSALALRNLASDGKISIVHFFDI